MDCGDLDRDLKPLLDDLLEEERYQALHEHLAACARCQARVGAIGSVSYVLKALGGLEAPKDLASSVLFAWRQPFPSAAPVSRPSRRSLVLGLLGALAGAALVSAAWWRMDPRRHAVPAPAPSPAGSPGEPGAGTRGDAEAYAQLQAIAQALGVTPGHASPPSGAAPSPRHWHLRLASAAPNGDAAQVSIWFAEPE